MKYLGHIIDKDRLKICEDKVLGIVEIPTPTNVTELKSYLGMVNYYGKFIKYLSTLLSLLHKWLKKYVQFSWNDNYSAAFDKVKKLLKSDKVLTHYNPSLPVTMSCDASEYGIGAFISHKFPDSSDQLALLPAL